jgi:hypothetical protein
MDGVSGRPGVGSSGTRPPAAGTTYSGNYMAGLAFQVTQGSTGFQGYCWWVAASNQDTAALKFALWQITGNQVASLVPGSVVTSGALTAGQWNYVPLSVPLALSAYIPYLAVIGGVFTTGFPDTANQFGAAEPYVAGITNGPLFAYTSGGAADQFWPQQPYTTAASDPATAFPSTNNLNDLLWLDVQVTDTDPHLGLYRAFPSMVVPVPEVVTANDQTGYTLGLEFSLTQSCLLKKIWHYSPTGAATDGGAAATVLPSRCAIWNVGTQAIVGGSDNQAPAWKKPDGTAAAAGAGWVYCDYSASGVTLAPNTNYKVSTFHAAGANWFGAVGNVWAGAGLYANGMTQGPLVIPNNAGASPGQQSWNTVTWGYPNTSTNPESDWVDVEVSPAPAVAAGGAGGDESRQTALKKMDWLLLYLYVCVHGPSTSVRLTWVCGMSLRRQQPRGAASQCQACWQR